MLLSTRVLLAALALVAVNLVVLAAAALWVDGDPAPEAAMTGFTGAIIAVTVVGWSLERSSRYITDLHHAYGRHLAAFAVSTIPSLALLPLTPFFDGDVSALAAALACLSTVGMVVYLAAKQDGIIEASMERVVTEALEGTFKELRIQPSRRLVYRLAETGNERILTCAGNLIAAPETIQRKSQLQRTIHHRTWRELTWNLITSDRPVSVDALNSVVECRLRLLGPRAYMKKPSPIDGLHLLAAGTRAPHRVEIVARNLVYYAREPERPDGGLLSMARLVRYTNELVKFGEAAFPVLEPDTRDDVGWRIDEVLGVLIVETSGTKRWETMSGDGQYDLVKNVSALLLLTAERYGDGVPPQQLAWLLVSWISGWSGSSAQDRRLRASMVASHLRFASLQAKQNAMRRHDGLGKLLEEVNRLMGLGDPWDVL